MYGLLYENVPTVFKSSCIVLHFLQWPTRVSVAGSLAASSGGQMVCLFILAFLGYRQWCLTVALICISLMVNAIEHFFMCILAIFHMFLS